MTGEGQEGEEREEEGQDSSRAGVGGLSVGQLILAVEEIPGCPSRGPPTCANTCTHMSCRRHTQTCPVWTEMLRIDKAL